MVEICVYAMKPELACVRQKEVLEVRKGGYAQVITSEERS